MDKTLDNFHFTIAPEGGKTRVDRGDVHPRRSATIRIPRAVERQPRSLELVNSPLAIGAIREVDSMIT